MVNDLARRVHHERCHRFFSCGAWKPDTLGQLLFERIVATLCPHGRLVVALDDTLAPKKGPEVFGIGSHLDRVRSTKGFGCNRQSASNEPIAACYARARPAPARRRADSWLASSRTS